MFLARQHAGMSEQRMHPQNTKRLAGVANVGHDSPKGRRRRFEPRTPRSAPLVARRMTAPTPDEHPMNEGRNEGRKGESRDATRDAKVNRGT